MCYREKSGCRDCHGGISENISRCAYNQSGTYTKSNVKLNIKMPRQREKLVSIVTFHIASNALIAKLRVKLNHLGRD